MIDTAVGILNVLEPLVLLNTELAGALPGKTVQHAGHGTPGQGPAPGAAREAQRPRRHGRQHEMARVHARLQARLIWQSSRSSAPEVRP